MAEQTGVAATWRSYHGLPSSESTVCSLSTVQSSAWTSPDGIVPTPTTEPSPPIARASLMPPPDGVVGAPRSCMPDVAVHANAWTAVGVAARPTTRPSSSIAFATLKAPPRVPRSRIPPRRVQDERVLLAALREARSNDLTASIDSCSEADGSAQCADVMHAGLVGPDECMRGS